jgi:hypothetical protein
MRGVDRPSRAAMRLAFWSLLLCAGGTRTACTQPSFSLLPEAPLFPTLRADGLEHQLSLSTILDNREWIGDIGVAVPLLRFSDSSYILQTGAAGTVFSRLLKTPGHISVITLDYRVDFPLELAVPSGIWRLGYGHISGHFADDGVALFGPRQRNVVKDYLLGGYARIWKGLGGTSYVQAQWNYHNLPYADKRWMLQVGFNSTDFRTSGWLALYAAGDIKWKEEAAWGSTRSLQVGVVVSGSSARKVRLAYTWRSGLDDRGQFFESAGTLNLISLIVGW